MRYFYNTLCIGMLCANMPSAFAACLSPAIPKVPILSKDAQQLLEKQAALGDAKALYQLSLRMPRHDVTLGGIVQAVGLIKLGCVRSRLQPKKGMRLHNMI